MGTEVSVKLEGIAKLSTGSFAGEAADNPLFVASIEKGLRVLNAFLGEQSLGLAEIASITGLDKSTVQRFVFTWHALGYLRKDERARRYRCSPKMLDWALLYFSSDPLISLAAPFLLELVDETKQATNLGRLVGVDVIYVTRIPSRRARLTAPFVGGRAPAFCTASGRAILSRMPAAEMAAVLDSSSYTALTQHTIVRRRDVAAKIEQAKREGYTIAIEECLAGEITVAAPVVNTEGYAIASLNLSMRTKQWDAERVKRELAPAVISTAAAISRALGG